MYTRTFSFWKKESIIIIIIIIIITINARINEKIQIDEKLASSRSKEKGKGSYVVVYVVCPPFRSEMREEDVRKLHLLIFSTKGHTSGRARETRRRGLRSIKVGGAYQFTAGILNSINFILDFARYIYCEAKLGI